MRQHNYGAYSAATISPAANVVIHPDSADGSRIKLEMVDSDDQSLGEVEVVMVSEWYKSTIPNVEGLPHLRGFNPSQAKEFVHHASGVGLLGGRPVIVELV